MAVEIRPEPSGQERAALLRVLALIAGAQPAPPGAAWRRAGLEAVGDRFPSAPPPRGNDGAVRA